MFIEVIPLDSSIDASWLTYFVADQGDFSVGSLVEIPLRNSLSLAVVTKMGSPAPSTENIRSIVSIICSIPLLGEYQAESILFIADRYFVHAHRALSLFLSKWLVRYLEKKSFIQLEKAWVHEKVTPKKPKLMHYQENTDIHMVIDECLKDKESIVVIFPDDFSLDGFLRRFPEDENMLVIRDDITETQKYKRWIDVYNGQKKIIIWTRRLLYYNLSHYKEILYIEDSLRRTTLTFQHTYSNMEVLGKITESGGFETIIISTIPSIESLYKVHMGEYEFTS